MDPKTRELELGRMGGKGGTIWLLTFLNANTLRAMFQNSIVGKLYNCVDESCRIRGLGSGDGAVAVADPLIPQ